MTIPIPMPEKLEMIDLSLLDDHPDNSDIYYRSDEELEELELDIAKRGLINPLVVKSTENGRYRINSGHRRKRVLIKLGITQAPCILLPDGMNENLALVRANVQVRKKSPIEIAHEVRYVKEELGISKGSRTDLCHDGRSVSDVLSEIFGTPYRTLQRYDKLNDLIPELKLLVEAGTLTITNGANLATKLSAYDQKMLQEAIGDNGIANLGAEEIRRLQEENNRGFIMLEVMQRQINDLEEKVTESETLNGQKEEVLREIKRLENKKRNLECEVANWEQASKKKREEAKKQGATLTMIVEQVVKPIAAAKPKIEALLETPVDANTATHLLKWVQAMMEMGGMLQNAIEKSLKRGEI